MKRAEAANCFLTHSIHRSATQLDERLCLDGFHSDRCRRLLVRLHSEQIQQGAHFSDDEGSGQSATRRAEPPGPAESVSGGGTTKDLLQISVLSLPVWGGG